MTPQPSPPSAQRVAYTPAQLAEAVGIAEAAVRRYIREGHLKANRLGGRLFIPAAEVDRVFGSGDAA
jgi:excisionase family DNA binding protein